MLAEQLLTKSFWIPLAIGLLVALVFSLAAKHYNRSGELKVAAASFREPIGHMMSALGVLVPLLIGAIAYLFDKGAVASVGLLLSAACLLFIAFGVASWLIFALPSRSAHDDSVTLTYPQDWPYKAASGLVYIGLLTGFIYVAIYFLVFFRAPERSAPVNSAPVLVQRAAPRVGQTRSEVRSQLGEAEQITDGGSTWHYRTDRSRLVITFDARDLVMRITEEE